MTMRTQTLAVKWPVAGTDSKEFDTQGMKIVGVEFPASFSGTGVTLKKLSGDGTSYVAVDSSVVFTKALSTYVPLTNLALTSGINKAKLVSSTSESAGTTVYVSLWGAE